jgi:lysine/ornithine N-monooxygenase
MAGGEPTTWANISHHYAVEAMVPNGALITREYVTEESKVVDAQLALGGLRLARVLNRILAAPEAPAAQATPAASPAPAATPQQPPQ